MAEEAEASRLNFLWLPDGGRARGSAAFFFDVALTFGRLSFSLCEASRFVHRAVTRPTWTKVQHRGPTTTAMVVSFEAGLIGWTFSKDFSDLAMTLTTATGHWKRSYLSHYSS